MSTVIQRSFAGGEISPSLQARVDIARYGNSCSILRNFQVLRHGGASNRAGSQYVGEVKDSSRTVRLIPFIFNASQTYALEFGHQYIRIIKNGDYVTDLTKTITNITKAFPPVVTAPAHTLAAGDVIKITGVNGMGQINNRFFKVDTVTTNTFTMSNLNGSLSTTGYDAYTSGGTLTRVYQVASSYVEADLRNIQYVQSADTMTLTHRNYPPARLSRVADNSWTLSNYTFAPGISPPSGASVTPTATTGGVYYIMTAISELTGEESLPGAVGGIGGVGIAGNTPTSSAPNSVGWAPVTGASAYNIYRTDPGPNSFEYYFIGSVGANTTYFTDSNIPANKSIRTPISRNPFVGAGNYPATCAYIQQRLVFANTYNDPEKVWTSRTGAFGNFTVATPSQDDQAITFRMLGRQVNEVRYLLDVGQFLVLTSGGEWAIQGDGGVITPVGINPKQYSYNGSVEGLQPLIIGNTALYTQARGSIIRDLAFNFQSDGYTGNDLTVYAAHLFDKYTIKDWTYQQIPHSTLWAVRSDGVLLGLTYLKEQEMLAWHRHDTDGIYENVCSIPEGNEDVLYAVVRRTVNGQSLRYVERFATRKVIDIKDSKFLDSHLSYDGRNTTAGRTVTLSGGTTWDYQDQITITASAGIFKATDIDNIIQVTVPGGGVIRVKISDFGSSTVVYGYANKNVPLSLRNVSTELFALAVDELSGLWHLEGKSVSVFGDGEVVANPNNPAYTVVTVSQGKITLDKPYAVIHVGLPYTSDLQTLDIDSVQSETLANKNKLITQVTTTLEDSRGGWVGSGPPKAGASFVDGLNEIKERSTEGYDLPINLITKKVSINIQSEWNSSGRIFIRQTDPLPFSILAVAPAGLIPFRQQG